MRPCTEAAWQAANNASAASAPVSLRQACVTVRARLGYLRIRRDDAATTEELPTMARTARLLPAPLFRGAQRFARWRGKRTTHSIPAPLWTLATRLGVEHGVSRASRALGVAYHALRKRVEAATSSPPRRQVSPSAFVELLPPVSRPAAEHVVELVDASGTRMRIETRDGSTLDLVALSRLFLEHAS
jgi:hypothetical protein